MAKHTPRIAIVYDRINKWGGAERVLLALHSLFPAAPLYTSVYDPVGAAWIGDWVVHPSFIQKLPFARINHEMYAPLMPYAFEAFDFSAFDVIISVTSAEAKGIITKPHQLHLSYQLTPTRYLWSHTHHYRGGGAKGALLLPFLSALRRWDYIAAQRPDYLIPISRTVAARIKKYYHRQAEKVIYPPVATSHFLHHPRTCVTKHRGYFLIVSRLVGYKSVDLVINTFRTLPADRLLIVGKGRHRQDWEESAPSNVTFLGSVSEDRLACLYHHAQALIFPQEEDFGIAAVEAQAAGTPVIAYRAGGATETVVSGKTGIFFDTQSVDSLTLAIHALKTHTWYDKTIQAHARAFDEQVFRVSLKHLVEEKWQQHT